MSAIALNNLSKRYGATVALDDLTLHVPEGEFLTLLGPSGSGKSTILSLIAGLTEPTSGSIQLGERDVTQLPPAQRNIGLVFQSYALFPHLSVHDNVAFPLEVRKIAASERERRVASVLELLRLGPLAQRKPAQLSGGQQQRVALARALVFQPDTLLLDEPMAALDRQLRLEVQVELRRLHRSLGTTTILVTHDQEEALSLSDRIGVLADGRLQQAGAPRELYARPQTEFVAGFLGHANFLHGELRSDGGRQWLVVDGAAPLAVSAPAHAAGSAVKAVVRPERTRLHPMQDNAPGLKGQVTETIYLGQTTRYHVRSDGGAVFVATCNERDARHAPGDAVLLSWAEKDIWVLPAPLNQE